MFRSTSAAPKESYHEPNPEEVEKVNIIYIDK